MYLIMKFKTDEDSVYSLKLNDIAITKVSRVSEVMDEIIETNAIKTAVGNLTAKESASVYNVTISDIALA